MRTNYRGNRATWSGMKGERRKPEPLHSERVDRLTMAIKEACAALRPRDNMSTRDLVDTVCGSDADDQRDCYALLRTVGAQEALSAYWTRGAPIVRPNGIPFRPFIWHAPNKPCPYCKGSGYLAHVPAVAEPAQKPTDEEIFLAYCRERGLDPDHPRPTENWSV